MSIATRTGDDGTTGLLYGQRINKTHKLIAAVGDLDEASAAIGLAKVWSDQTGRREILNTIQRHLIDIMGEINCICTGELAAYTDTNGITESDLAVLDAEILRLEASTPPQKGWILYGDGSSAAAAFDMASKVTRRAERSYLRLINGSVDWKFPQLERAHHWHRPIIGKYINRLSDLLHLMARAS